MHRSANSQRPFSASDFIRLGQAMVATANNLFGTPCETRLIAYNRTTGDFTDTKDLTALTDTLFKSSEHVHLAIKPINECAVPNYKTEHGNYMPQMARLQVLNGGPPRAEFNGVEVNVADLPKRIPAHPQPALKTPATPAGGLVI